MGLQSLLLLRGAVYRRRPEASRNSNPSPAKPSPSKAPAQPLLSSTEGDRRTGRETSKAEPHPLLIHSKETLDKERERERERERESPLMRERVP